MILLSPPKLLMILVIALIVLGPDKLPATARRVGAMWSDVKRWRTRLEAEVRDSFPDLPSTTEIARAVRSPLSMLDHLAEEHVTRADVDAPSSTSRRGSDPPAPPPTPPTPPTPVVAPVVATSRPHPVPRIDAALGPDVPSMN
jgi:Sec-independent protein translocase protein TatA